MNAREIGEYHRDQEAKYGYPLSYLLPMSKYQVINLTTTYNPTAAYGGMEDHYIKSNGECHPDFETIYINKVGGPKVCRRVVYDNHDSTSPHNGGGYEKTHIDKSAQVLPKNTDKELRDLDYIRSATVYNWSGLPRGGKRAKGTSIY